VSILDLGTILSPQPVWNVLEKRILNRGCVGPTASLEYSGEEEIE